MPDLFSTPAEHAFEHAELEDVQPQAGPSSMGDAVGDMSVEEAFEVEDAVRRILDGAYTTIGLQFPDELLPSSVPVFRAIQQRIASSGAQAYILADSTYGSCCPDILSCLHLPADFLVHYGHACLTPTDAIPVHYVFPRRKVDLDVARKGFMAVREDVLADDPERTGVVVVWDVAYDWAAEQVMAALSQQGVPMAFAVIRQPATAAAAAAAAGVDGKPPTQGKAPALRVIEPPAGLGMERCMIWYIGQEGRALLNLQMTHADTPIAVHTPSTGDTRLLTGSSRLLQRRLLSIHTAVTSDVFGLVVHSVGLKSSNALLDELRRTLRRHKKKSYTLTVGRINPAKLANFDSIECFVLVGCNEGGLVDSKDFYRPIITPWELLLALQGPEHEWQPSKWTLDISKVLEAAKGASAGEDGVNADSRGSAEEKDEDAPVFSLVDGTYKARRKFGSGEDAAPGVVEGVKDLTLRNKDFSLAKLESAGSTYLSSRSFQGLEMRYGLDEPAELEQGREGIARGYTEER